MKPLRVTIITVCLNAEQLIEQCITSVIAQTYPNIEYIIVDGQSTDMTLEIVNAFHPRIAKIFSEKDKGIYDAMNKGVRASTGDILYFLNSDDSLYDHHVIEDIVHEFNQNSSADMLYGIVTGVYPASANRPTFDTPKVYSISDIYHTYLCHQGLFVKRTAFDAVGLFNSKYRICADLDWVLRALNKELELANIDRKIAHFSLTGLTIKNPKLRRREKRMIFLKNCSWLQLMKIIFNRNRLRTPQE